MTNDTTARFVHLAKRLGVPPLAKDDKQKRYVTFCTDDGERFDGVEMFNAFLDRLESVSRCHTKKG